MTKPTESGEGRVEDRGGHIRAVRADNPGPLTLSGTQTYVIGSGPVVVLDPGPRVEAHLARVDEAVGDRAVAAVCLTHAHADHAASAPAAAARWGPLRASAETLRRLSLDGQPLQDGEEISLGEVRLRALAAPGHSGDHTCYLALPARDLFTGDLVLGEGSSIIVHPDGSVAACLTSLARLHALRPARLMPGHGPVVADASARLEAYRVHRLERARHVLEAVRDGADSLDAIRRRVYIELPETHHRAAELSILAYLAYLRAQGHEVPGLDP